MVLLTSSQVSIAVSSGIVLIFTFALFLSGYVLQQQTVRGLQAAIKPRLPLLLESIPLLDLEHDPPPLQIPGNDDAGSGKQIGEEGDLRRERSGKVFSVDHFKEHEEPERKRHGREWKRGSIFSDVVVATDEDGNVVGIGKDKKGRNSQDVRDGPPL